jgi:dienelactone hydrolase
MRSHRQLLAAVFAFAAFSAISSAQSVPAPRVVDLTATDGTKLKATYFAAAKPGPGVILLHQCNRQRKVWDGLAQQLSAAGINVLTLDYRGFGESGGERFDKLAPQARTELTQKWPEDIDQAFRYLISQPGVRKDVIGVGGASCGVNNSIQLARRHPGEVKSLVLLSGNTDLGGRQFLRSSKLPVLFAVADDDEFPPTVQVIEWLYTIPANPGKKLLHYSKGGHGADMFPVHPELPTAIVDWYTTTLIKTPGNAPASAETPAIPAEIRTLDLIDQPGGAAKVTQMLQQSRQRDPNATLFPEALVNIVGYEHLQSGDTKGAIEILKLNAMAFPDSPNVYDSVSDAYLADGQKELARDNAKKALELLATDTKDPENTRKGIKDNAEQKLRQLGESAQVK